MSRSLFPEECWSAPGNPMGVGASIGCVKNKVSKVGKHSQHQLLHTDAKHAEGELSKTISFAVKITKQTTTDRNRKWLGINTWPRKGKALQFKTLKKTATRKTLEDGKTVHTHGLEGLNIENVILPKTTYRFNKIHIKNQMMFFIEKNLKIHMEAQKTFGNRNNPEQKIKWFWKFHYIWV